MSIHIPDVQRIYFNMLNVMQRLEKELAEFRDLAAKNQMPRDVAHEVFYQAELHKEFAAHITELKIHLEAADNMLIDVSNSTAKRGRKFRHFERMLIQLTAKVRRVHGKTLQTQGPVWTDVPE